MATQVWLTPGPDGPSDEQALDAYHLWNVEGYSTYGVAAHLKISQPTASRWINRGRELYHQDRGEASAKERRRKAAQDADAWLRAQAQKITMDIAEGRIDRDAGYRHLLALHDRRARLEGTDAPRRAAVKAKGKGDVKVVGLPTDVFGALSRLDPSEVLPDEEETT